MNSLVRKDIKINSFNHLKNVPNPLKPPKKITHVTVKHRKELIRIEFKDIYYLKAEDKYVTIYHKGGSHLTETSIKTFEEIIGDGFIRIHRNCLVKKSQMKKIAGVDLILKFKPENRLPVSRRNIPVVRKTLKELSK